MRVVVQRVKEASVAVGGVVKAAIGPGLVVLLGVAKGDDEQTGDRLADRVCRLRIFEDDQGKMNRSLLDVAGQVLVVSQFTLCADTSRGLRPSFEAAEEPGRAKELCDRFADQVQAAGVDVKTGVFGARMAVRLENDGPVTLVLDSRVNETAGKRRQTQTRGGSAGSSASVGG